MKVQLETSAGGIVFKKEKGTLYWLLVKPAKRDWWGFPKGRVGDKVRNESNQEAALREVQEETGITANIIPSKSTETKYVYRLGNYLIKKNVLYYLMEGVSGDTTHHDNEISEVRWVTTEDALELLTYKNDRDAFSRILKQQEV